MILRTQTLTSIANGSKGIAECQNPAVVTYVGRIFTQLSFPCVVFFLFLFFSHISSTPTHLPENSYIFPKDDLLGIFLIKNAKNIPPTNETEHILNAEQKL